MAALADLGTEEFRAVFRDYLEKNRPVRDSGGSGGSDWLRDFARKLFDDGFAAPSWPRQYGGMDLPLASQYVYQEELARARLRAHPTTQVWIVGPTLIRHGSPEQKERFLVPMLRADEIWCQGFSEPEAGSDLPSLRTRAKREGEDYVVTGQKVWTSGASTSDWMFGLVRTGPESSGTSGISYLLIDMNSPGIDVRPLRDMTGGARFAEVFFDQVRVPRKNLVGEEGAGWRIARTTLGHERSTSDVAGAVRYRRIVNDLFVLAKEMGRSSDKVLRQELADIEIKVRLIERNAQRIMADLLTRGEPGPASSISRLFYAQFEKRLHEVAMDVLGPKGLLDPTADGIGRWIWGFLSTRASTIGAGTAEIQRNTIAERVLGLPREPTAG